MDDPAVDLTDLFAFPSPARPEHLVLIMDAFPLAGPRAMFSDAVSYRFRLRPLTRANSTVYARSTRVRRSTPRFDDVRDGTSPQTGIIVTPGGRECHLRRRRIVGAEWPRACSRGSSAIRSSWTSRRHYVPTIPASTPSRKHGKNTVEFRDFCRSSSSFRSRRSSNASAASRWSALIAETIVPNLAKPIRIERLGRPELKNLILQHSAYDPRTTGCRASGSVQPGGRFCALEGVSPAVRIASRCEPRVLRQSRRQGGVAARCRRAASAARPAH